MKMEKLYQFKWHLLPQAGIRHEQYRRALLPVIHQNKQSGFQPIRIRIRIILTGTLKMKRQRGIKINEIFYKRGIQP